MSEIVPDLGQMWRLKPAKQADHRDIGGLPGKVDSVHFSRREVRLWWQDRGTRINLSFDDVEISA